MSHASSRSWVPTRHDLSLPRWAFVACLIRQRRLGTVPHPVLTLAPAGDIEANRRARLLRELVPQDA